MARHLLLVALSLVTLAAACGSGEQAQPTGTATSQRAEREATVAQQQDAEAPQEAVEAELVQQSQQAQQTQQAQQSVADVEQQQQTQQAQEEVEDAQPVDELPAEIVGVHKGVRSERHVLGEPDAPVEIRYFGDFT